MMLYLFAELGDKGTGEQKENTCNFEEQGNSFQGNMGKEQIFQGNR